MRKFLSVLLSLVLVFSLAACSKPPAPTPGPETPDEPKWKVAVVTNTVSQNEEEYRSAEFIVQKYGKDHIVHELWPDNFMTEQEQMISVLGKLAADPDIKAIVINQAVAGTNAAVDKFLESRDKEEVLIVYAGAAENAPDIIQRADVTLMADTPGQGPAIVQQAAKQGAKTVVHYSFPRHMSYAGIAERFRLMEEEGALLGITIVDATAPDPTSEAGVAGAQQFILEDVPKKVAQYGPDTAFYSTNCSMQVPLITQVVATGAIYPQPCCPSPYHGFPSALGLDVPDDIVGGLQDVIDQTTKILVEKGLGGRLSTWPVPMAMMCTIAGTDYAVEWIKGNTNGKQDRAVLEKVMADYAGLPVNTKPYVEAGVSYETIYAFLLDYLTYGDLPN